MVEQDTIKLLREGDGGVKMGISSIGGVLGQVREEELEQLRTDCKKDHETLEKELREQLDRYQDDGKEPNPMARGMAQVKANV